MRSLALVLAAVAALVASSARAAPAQYDYDRWLGTVARTSLWRSAADTGLRRERVQPVSVRCYRDRAAFELAFESRSGTSADRVVAYYTGGRDVHLRSGTCTNARLFLQGRHTVLTAGAFAVLLHESLHRQGLLDERFTTCFANESVRWGAIWFGFDDSRALRARNLAFTYTRVYAPRQYRMSKPNCLALARRTSWTDLV